MGTFTAIFTQLGVDSSLLPQFFIILGIFIISNFLFLRKLQEIIEVREEKTVKLENSADVVLDKVTRMQSEYKLKIDEANRNALKMSSTKKAQITEKYTSQFKQTEKEINQFIDQSRTEFGQQVAGQKEAYLAETEALSQSLVQKILQ